MDSDKLVDELVESQTPVEIPTEAKVVKRNSKDELIKKIISLSEEVGEPVKLSNSQLKRMSKNALTDVLAGYVEKRIEFEAQKCLGIDKEQAGNPYCVNLAALKMVHEIAVNSTEALVERTSEKHGMTISGFKRKMKESQESIDMILSEIAQLYPEVLEKFSSPWVRLGLLWTSNVVLTLKKKEDNNKKNASNVRFRSDTRIHTV
jgi:hypothetical protein